MIRIKCLPMYKIYQNDLLYKVLKSSFCLRQGALKECLNQKCNGYAFLAVEDGELVGWGMCRHEIAKTKYYSLMLYVRPEYRRNGIGELLIEKATKFVRKKRRLLVTFPHDYKSREFFNQADVFDFDERSLSIML